jgi:hypothetical protein
MVKHDNTELLVIQMSYTAATMQLNALDEGCPHPTTLTGYCMSQQRSGFIRSGINYNKLESQHTIIQTKTI